MKKILNSLATITLICGSITSMSALTAKNERIPAPYIEPAIPSKAQAEANKLDHKTVTLNETTEYEYADKTAAQDAAAIKEVLVNSNILSATEAKDFSFNNTKQLYFELNYNIGFSVTTPAKQTASGVFDIYINQPPKKIKASLIGPSNPKASLIGPSNPKASLIGPSNPKASLIGPSKLIASETAEDIANKLFHQTIKLDPNNWLGQNLATEQTAFNAAIVQLGILTAGEVKYVTWNSLQINVAGWYWNEGFTVKKDGAIATGNVAINATTGETPAQIAAKLSKATIQFNYDWWNGKNLKDNWAQIPQIIANEHILTKAEASVVTGLASYKTVSGTGQFSIQMHVNDGNTDSIATPNINVVNDGLSATEIASKISGGTFYLHGSMGSKYADSSKVYKNFRNYLVDDTALFSPSFTRSDANAITLPHLQLNLPKTNLTATASKDGQAATAPITIVSHIYPELITQYQSASIFGLVVNLGPLEVNDLKDYFHYQTTDPQTRLECFYNALDDCQYSGWPTAGGEPDTFNWSDRLEALMGDYGTPNPSKQDTIEDQAKTSDSGNKAFEVALANKLVNTPYNRYLTVYFRWYYAHSAFGTDTNTTEYWGFW